MIIYFTIDKLCNTIVLLLKVKYDFTRRLLRFPFDFPPKT